jgi:hypothetical protein
MNQPSVECLDAVPGLRLELRIVGPPESQPALRYYRRNERTILYNAAEHQQNYLRNIIRAALRLDDGVLFFPAETNVVVELLHFLYHGLGTIFYHIAHDVLETSNNNSRIDDVQWERSQILTI